MKRIVLLALLVAGTAWAEEPVLKPSGDLAAWPPLFRADVYTIHGPTFTITEETTRKMKDGDYLAVRDGKLELVTDIAVLACFRGEPPTVRCYEAQCCEVTADEVACWGPTPPPPPKQ